MFWSEVRCIPPWCWQMLTSLLSQLYNSHTWLSSAAGQSWSNRLVWSLCLVLVMHPLQVCVLCLSRALMRPRGWGRNRSALPAMHSACWL